MVGRFLLKAGRGHENSVKAVNPYTEIKEVNEDARVAELRFLELAFKLTKKGYISVNNRLEGNGSQTISAVIAAFAALYAHSKLESRR